MNSHHQAHHGRYFLALLLTVSSWQRIRQTSTVSLMILETMELSFFDLEPLLQENIDHKTAMTVPQEKVS